MKCPTCETTVELSWSRYLKSIRGIHDCPKCSTIFKIKITRRYLLLWLDIIIAGVFTAAGLNHFLIGRYGYAHDDPVVLSILIIVPTLIWGTVFLVLNRCALNRLNSKAI